MKPLPNKCRAFYARCITCCGNHPYWPRGVLNIQDFACFPQLLMLGDVLVDSPDSLTDCRVIDSSKEHTNLAQRERSLLPQKPDRNDLLTPDSRILDFSPIGSGTAKTARAVRAFATGARSERKQSTKQSHRFVQLLAESARCSDPSSFPDQSVAGFSVVLAKENADFDAFVKEEVAPRHSHSGRR